MPNSYSFIKPLALSITFLTGCSSVTVIDDTQINTLDSKRCNALTEFSTGNPAGGSKQLKNLSQTTEKLLTKDADKITITAAQQLQLNTINNNINTFLIPYMKFQQDLKGMDKATRSLMEKNSKSSYLHLEALSAKTSMGIIRDNLHYYHQQANVPAKEKKQFLAAVSRLDSSLKSIKDYAPKIQTPEKQQETIRQIDSLYPHWVYVKKYLVAAQKTFIAANQRCEL